MALVVKDRVQETTTTVGTGTYTLAGALTGYQTFSAVGNSNTTYYTVTNDVDWEVGLGTYTSAGTTLSRDSILASSNSNNAVNWGAGTKRVFVDYPAGKAVLDGGTNSLNINGTVGATTPNTGAFTTLSATGVATFSAGTAAAPAITTSGDTNNGIFFPAADVTAITTSGSERLRIDSSGNVGIGTASPGTILNVYRATQANIQLQGDAGTNINVYRYSDNTLSASLNLRKYRGTLASPTANASGDQLGSILFQGYGGTNARNLAAIIGYVDTYTSDSNISAYLTFSTTPSGSAAYTERMRIDQAGYVGINTASPSTNLHVAGSIIATSGVTFGYTTNIGIGNGLILGTAAKATAGAGGQGTVSIYSNDASNRLEGSIALITDATAGNRRLAVSVVEQGVAYRNITLAESGGNVGIGTTAPNVLLEVNGTSTAEAFRLTGLPKFAGTNSTGAGSAALGSNSPATTNTAPYTWIKAISSDGSTVYLPAWK